MSFSEVMNGLHDQIDRCRPAFLVMECLLFIVGCMFWIFTSLGGDAFKPDLYGVWATTYPAEAWAMVMMCGSACMISGFIRPVRNWMVWTGGLIQCAQFAALAWSAMFTGGEFAVAVWAGVFFLTMHVWITMEALIGYE